ncbi:hypothetical protein I6I07_19580 [Achromobacter deleyi]|uniref:Uncharacterized protein n=1 Tax=Achromobacter deleyi TaxID=1353891 RepID=A0A7T4AZC4_9BURK|nr:hypothetical protein [Achromobacter deleyi]QQB32848.1 hypothetical protein I6I07_19580 [Achromobacter deleyi]
MHTWPYDTLTPEVWAALPADDKAMVEALTAAFIAEVERQRAARLQAPDTDD